MSGPLTDRKLPASWLVTLCEPLVSVAERVALESSMITRCDQAPQWATRWFTGMIADHVLSLPAGDPWRHLSARVVCDVDQLTRGSGALPEFTGALGEHGAFGSVLDGGDLVPEVPGPGSISTDVSLAALGPGLPSESAAVVAFCADDFVSGTHAVEVMRSPGGALAGEGGLGLFTVLSAALRWVMWRRRAYLDSPDELAIASGFAWLWRADELSAGKQLPDIEFESLFELRRHCSLAHLDYQEWRMDMDAF